MTRIFIFSTPSPLHEVPTTLLELKVQTNDVVERIQRLNLKVNEAPQIEQPGPS